MNKKAINIIARQKLEIKELKKLIVCLELKLQEMEEKERQAANTYCEYIFDAREYRFDRNLPPVI